MNLIFKTNTINYKIHKKKVHYQTTQRTHRLYFQLPFYLLSKPQGTGLTTYMLMALLHGLGQVCK